MPVTIEQAIIETIEMASRYKGVRTWDFCQSEGKLRDALGGRGACWSFSVYWLHCLAINSHLRTVMGGYTNKKGKFIKINKKRAKTFLQLNDLLVTRRDELRALLLGMGLSTLTMSQDIEHNPVELFAHADKMASGHDRKFLLYTDDRTQKSGHAMSYIVRTGLVLFFDPNVGEFSFPSSRDFINFLIEFLPSMYGGFPTFQYQEVKPIALVPCSSKDAA